VTPSASASPPSALRRHSLGEGRGDVPAGHRPEAAWLELAVEADLEAVETVSEVLSRVAPGGVSVEPSFELVDEGLGARLDPSRPAVVRAYVPARDARAAEEAAASADEALGHIRPFELRPIGPLATRIVHEEDWAAAWKLHFPVLRIGRHLVIRPTWRRHRALPGDVVIALDPGMAFGTGLHPSTRLCLVALESLELDGARVLDVGCGSGILSIAAARLGAHRVDGVDTDPIAIEATLANVRRNRLVRRIRPRLGTLPSDRGPFDVVLANLVASVLVALASELAAELAYGGTIVASGIVVDREADVRVAFEAAGLSVGQRDIDGDWIALTARAPRR
jgi:ribosomal protein L11 methyltransferase